VQPSCRESSSPDGASARAGVAKFVVAGESAWTGELYGTRGCQPRLRFRSLETFCNAFLAATGWALQPAIATDSPLVPFSNISRIRSGAGWSGNQKFIVSAAAPWSGEIYRTRPGLAHLRFTTFDEFVLAVLTITGWSLTPGGEVDPAPVPSRLGASR
jgi:hypothetical protein